jgi:hypothetical protein
MSSFQVGATLVTFSANMDGFEEQRPTLLRSWTFDAYLALSTDYTVLYSLYSYPVSIRTCPGSAGATSYADIGGGAGRGTLTLDNVIGSPFNAALSQISRPSAYPGGGRRCRVTFLEVP